MDNHLKQARINAGLTQKELADSICVSQQAVQQWENGNTIPQSDRLLDVSRACAASILDVYPLDNNKAIKQIGIDYSAEWTKTLQYLNQLPVANELEQFVKNSAIYFAKAKEGHTKHYLGMTEAEYHVYTFWKSNTVLPIGENGTSFWKCFFPQDYFLTTSAFHPLMAGKTAAVVENLAGFGLLINNDMLQEPYYPELMPKEAFV